MNAIIVSTWKSRCSGCKGNVIKADTATTCDHCGNDFDAVMMLVETAKPFHASLPHVAPMDYPDIHTHDLTWCRPFFDRLPYEVVPHSKV